MSLPRKKSAKNKIMLTSFSLAKLTTFLWPFWIASNSSITFYGTIELYLSAGVWLAMIIGLGVPGSIPVQILKNKNTHINSLSAWLILTAASMAVLATTIIHHTSNNYLLSLLPCIVLFSLAQQIASPLLKSQKTSPLSPWLDNLSIHIVALTYTALYFVYGKDAENFIHTTLVIASILILAYTLYWLRLKQKDSPHQLKSTYIESVKLGIPIILNGLIMMLIFNSGRLFIGYFYSEIEVAVYSYLFRIAGVSLIFYQFYSLMFFKEIYIATSKQISNKLVQIFIAITSTSIASHIALQELGHLFIPAEILNSDITKLFPIIATQINLWILSAILETRINSAGLSKRSAKLCLIPTLILVASFFITEAMSLSNLFGACVLLCLAAFITIFIQTYTLNYKNSDPISVTTPIALACSPLLFIFGNQI